MKKLTKKKDVRQSKKQTTKKGFSILGIVRTIGFKLRVIPLVFILVAMAAVSIVSIQTAQRQMSSLVRENAVLQAENISDQIKRNNELNTFLQNKMQETVKAAANTVISQGNAVSNKSLISIAENLNVQEINVIDLSGKIIYSNIKDNIGFVFEKDKKVWKVISGSTQSIIDDVVLSSLSNDYYQYGYMSGGNKVVQVGVLANEYQSSIEETQIQQVVSNLSEKYGLVYVEYVDSNMEIKAHSIPGLANTTSSSQTIKQAMEGGKNVIKETNYNGKQVYEVTVPVSTASGTDAVQVASTLDLVTAVVRNIIIQTGYIVSITFIIISLIMYLIASSVIKPMKKLSEAAEDVAKGDLTKEIIIKAYKKDIIGKLAESFTIMKDSLKSSIKAIQESSSESAVMAEGLNNNSKQMAATATDVTSAIQEVAKGAEQQAYDLVRVSEDIEKLAGELENINSRMNSVKESNSFTENKAGIGEKQINTLLISIEELKKGLVKQAANISELGVKVEEVNDIANIISDISNQTNLLALNAAIEAARAGEAGRGFAVVSEEVRKLADQSKNAAEDAKKVISTIIGGTKEVLETSNSITAMADKQSGIAAGTQNAFNQMLEALAKVGPMIEDTYASLQKTIDAKDNIVSSVSSVTAVAQEISASGEEISASSEEMLASTEEVAESAENMERIAKGLHDETSKFTI